MSDTETEEAKEKEWSGLQAKDKSSTVGGKCGTPDQRGANPLSD